MPEHSTRKRQVLFLHKYSRKAAAFRYRFEQYFRSFEAGGIDVHVDCLFDDSYLDKLYSEDSRSYLDIIKAYWRRFLFLLRKPKSETRVVYMELFPYLPFFLEKLFLRKQSYILDFDDAFYLNYKKSGNPLVRWFLSAKPAKVIASAKAVVVGSPALFQFASEYNTSVYLIPTVVDTEKYKVAEGRSQSACPIIGWMGSPSTAKELAFLAKALHRLAAQHSFELLIVGAGQTALDLLPNLRLEEWSEKDELTQLSRMDIGIMPLRQNPWNEGKCGFKLIQYMAMGKPVVASNVGANKEIVQDGETGFLVQSEDDWFQALETLLKSPALRQTLGQNARRIIEKKYSLQVTAPQYLNLLHSAL